MDSLLLQAMFNQFSLICTIRHSKKTKKYLGSSFLTWNIFTVKTDYFNVKIFERKDVFIFEISYVCPCASFLHEMPLVLPQLLRQYELLVNVVYTARYDGRSG